MKDTVLELLEQKRIDWVRMVKSFGSPNSPVPEFLIEDIIHDMYIKLHDRYGSTPERILYTKEKLNTMLVYVTLKNLYTDYHRKQKHRNYIPQNVIEQLDFETEDLKDDLMIEVDRIEKLVQDEIESWHHYDRRLFKLIYYEGMSMRKLSRETKISLSSIFNTCKACKLKIEEIIVLDKQI